MSRTAQPEQEINALLSLTALAWLPLVLLLNIPLAAAAAAEQMLLHLVMWRWISPRARRWVAVEHSQRRMAVGDGYQKLAVDVPGAFAAFGLAEGCWQPAL